MIQGVVMCLKINTYLTFATWNFFADERDAIQKKTFTKWINNHLRKAGGKVTDLFQDLRDGQSLLTLLELLSAERLVSNCGTFIVVMCSFEYSTHSRAKKARCVSTCCKMWTRRCAFSSEKMLSWLTSGRMTSPTEIQSWHSDWFGQ